MSGNGIIGEPDSRVETSGDGTTWEPATIIPALPAYSTIPATLWVSNTSAPGTAVVHYRVRFMLPAAFVAAELGVILHADGAARVSLNGGEFGAQPQLDIPANSGGGPDGFGTVDARLFQPGENVLSFAVQTFGRPSALDFIAGVSYEAIPNRTPSANAGGPYAVAEGESTTLAATGTDPERGPLTFAWDLDGDSTFETAGQVATFVGIDGPATPTVAVRVCDVEPACTVATATVTVGNVAPAVAAPAVSVSGTTASIIASFSDPGPADGPFVCLVDWGDGSSTTGAVSGTALDGTCAATHSYPAAGTYPIGIAVADKDGDVGSASASAVIEVAVASSANTMIANVLASLRASLPTGDDATDRRIGKAIVALEDGLAPAGWVDGDHLDPATGASVFHATTKAVRALGGTESGVLTPTLAAAIDALVAADRLLAVAAIAAGGPPGDVARAIDHLAAADVASAHGWPEKAIEHQRKAWTALNR